MNAPAPPCERPSRCVAVAHACTPCRDRWGVFVMLSPQMRDQLDQLVEDGYHGEDISEAATRMLAKQLEGTQTVNGGGSGRAVGFALGGYQRTRRNQPRTIRPGIAPYLPFRTPKGESDER